MCSIGGSSSEMNHSYTAINLQIINKLNGNSRLSIWHFARLSQNFNFAKPRSEDFPSTLHLITTIPHLIRDNDLVKPKHRAVNELISIADPLLRFTPQLLNGEHIFFQRVFFHQNKYGYYKRGDN